MPYRLLLFWVLMMFVTRAWGNVHSARIDIVSEHAELLDETVTPLLGTTYRMNWQQDIPHSQTLVAEVPAYSFADCEYVLRFTPQLDDTVRIELKGPYQSNPNEAEMEIEFRSLTIAGAEWIVPPKLPARVTHDQPYRIHVRVHRGQRVAISYSVRWVDHDIQENRVQRTNDSPAHRLAKQFQRGVNLANYLEVPPGEDWGGLLYTEDDYRKIAAEGFDHVRLPVAWHHHCGQSPNFLIHEWFWERVEQQIDWAEKYGLAIIVNTHHFDAFMEDPQGQRQKFVALWKQIGERLAKRPDSVAFEILNEPHGAATTELMSEIYSELIPILRRSNPERAIFVGPSTWNLSLALEQLRLPDDDRLIVTVHAYDPMPFTHQNAWWSDETKAIHDVTFPGPPPKPVAIPLQLDETNRSWLENYNRLPAEENPCSTSRLEFEFSLARAWGESFGRPIHLGEFGVYEKVDSDSRARYLTAVRTLAEQNQMGWCLWDWRASFVYWDRANQQAKPGLHDALFKSDR
ncbi:MAG: glycoside hydrolase family 5 protein [Pirellulaceae bacterium]